MSCFSAPSSSRFTLDALTGELVIAHLPPSALAGPDGAKILSKCLGAGGPLTSISRTASEVSIIAGEHASLGLAAWTDSKLEKGWRALRVRGPLPFDVVGVVSTLSAPLAASGIPIFVVSVFETDYILVKVDSFARAISALRTAGHTVAIEADVTTGTPSPKSTSARGSAPASPPSPSSRNVPAELTAAANLPTPPV